VDKNPPDAVFVFCPQGTDIISLQSVPTLLPDSATEERKVRR